MQMSILISRIVGFWSNAMLEENIIQNYQTDLEANLHSRAMVTSMTYSSVTVVGDIMTFF